MNHSTHPESANLAAVASTPLIRNAGIVVLGSLFVGVCAHFAVPLPFTPVPLTLQPFAVLLLGMMLSPRLASATMAAYLAEGAIGLPVFAPAAGALTGFAHLFGPTGGYLLSYPIAIYAVAALWRGGKRTFGWALLSAASGDAILLAIGAVWLGILTRASAGTVLSQAVVPFLPGETLKVVLAASAGVGWYRLRHLPTDPNQ